MLDVTFPTCDGRTLLFERYTTPDKTQKLLLAQLGLELPEQSPPRITDRKTLEPLNPNSEVAGVIRWSFYHARYHV